MISAAQVVAAARTQIGVPWEHQARMWSAALDCAGLVICVARHLRLVPPGFDVNGYGPAPDGTMLRFCDAHMRRVDEIALGAVLALATEREAQHLAIVGDYVHGGFSLIHASNAGSRAVIESRLLLARRMRLRGVYMLPGVA